MYAAFVLHDPDQPLGDLNRRGRALEIHNKAVAHLIRHVDTDVRPGDSRETWRDQLDDLGIATGSPEPFFAPERLATVTVASDYKVAGMQAHYRTDGLGVALMARRLARPRQSTDPQDQFTPRSLMVPVTAVLEPAGALAGGSWRHAAQLLVFHDPYVTQGLPLGSWTAALATDRTAPLAAELDAETFKNVARMGLLRPDIGQVHVGLLMPQPYRPGKIPVVLVHGLNSTPATWVQTMNHLQNDPELAARYQFWLYLYPTGNPVLVSGMRLRGELALARQAFDPLHQDPAFDQTVLIGHSMGGLLSQLQVQDPGDTLAQTMFTRPLNEIKTTPELRSMVDNLVMFQSRPEVKRVIFIATPHLGSRIANGALGKTVARWIQEPPQLQQELDQFVALNGPGVISPAFRRVPFNSLGNLTFDSPVLAALHRIPIRPDVKYHTVALELGPAWMRLPSDGVVGYDSAHLDGAASELIVSGSHVDHQKMEVTREIKRILKIHLQEDATTLPPPSELADRSVHPEVDTVALRVQLESVRR